MPSPAVNLPRNPCAHEISANWCYPCWVKERDGSGAHTKSWVKEWDGSGAHKGHVSTWTCKWRIWDTLQPVPMNLVNGVGMETWAGLFPCSCLSWTVPTGKFWKIHRSGNWVWTHHPQQPSMHLRRIYWEFWVSKLIFSATAPSICTWKFPWRRLSWLIRW